MSQEREDEPKITVVDRRMLSDDDRAGKSPSPAEAPQVAAAAPETELEVVADEDDMGEEAGEEAISDEEMQQMRAAMEAEQFAAIEARVGRPLTDTEKDAVRAEMENQAREQAQQMSTLEVAPMMQQFLAEISARAAIHMGLMPNPYTRLIAKNDAEARLAIDTFAAVYEVLKPRLDPAIQKEYSRVLNDLRVNFSQQTGLPAGGFGSFGGPKIIH
ncbi:MAG TPA: DUF1844 domain-containing protein [Abditibacteriaceae bacterium]|jgi:hypothetical protein